MLLLSLYDTNTQQFLKSHLTNVDDFTSSICILYMPVHLMLVLKLQVEFLKMYTNVENLYDPVADCDTLNLLVSKLIT